MPNGTYKTKIATPRPAVQDGRDTLWSAVFAPSGSLSGFCLEWLLDKAECNDGRPS